MDYTEEDKEDKKYRKGYGRKEFKKDVAEAVEPVVNKQQAKSKMKPKRQKKGYGKSSYANMTATELRKLLNSKKKGAAGEIGIPGWQNSA